MKLSQNAKEALILGTAFFAIVLIAVSTWASQPFHNYCDGDFCASSADALRVMQQEGRY